MVEKIEQYCRAVLPTLPPKLAQGTLVPYIPSGILPQI